MNLRTRSSRLGRGRYRLGAAALAATALALPAAKAPAVGAGTMASALPPNCTQFGTSVTCTFAYTGAPQNLTIPAGWSSIAVTADGAQGGTGSQSPGGRGGQAQADLTVTPGEVIEVVVGSRGGPYYGAADGGFNGGGPGGSGAPGNVNSGVHGGGGGGASDVRFGACAATLSCGPAHRVLVAGGGGGSVWASSGFAGDHPSGFTGRGGDGGFPSGGHGASHATPNGGHAGLGAGQSGGGHGGAADPNADCTDRPTGGSPGGVTQDVGGTGGHGGVIYPATQSSNGGNGGGGGGGGYWGGGGGGGGCGYRDYPGAGGGGSSHGPVRATFTNGTWTGNGRVIIRSETTPDAPAIGHAVAGDSAARVTFTPPKNTGGTPVTSYTVTAADHTHPARGGQTATGPDSPLTPTGLTNGDTYTFTVTATNKIGTSPPSAASNPVTPNPLIYVANFLGVSITEYARGVTGNTEPFATIKPSGAPVGLALDRAGDLWVAEASNAVAEYAKTATGNTPPIATISGSRTDLNFPAGVAVDPAGDVWVANRSGNSVTEYAAGATGDTRPITAITGTGTGLSTPEGITLDPAGNVWVTNSQGDSVTEYAKKTTGNTPPIATISGTNTGIHAPRDVALDHAGNMWITNLRGSSGTGTGNGSVTEYTAGARGNIRPMTTISGSFEFPYGLALDSAGDLFVTNSSSGGAVNEYNPTTGAPPLIAKIQGNQTALNYPWGIVVSGTALGHSGRFAAAATTLTTPLTTPTPPTNPASPSQTGRIKDLGQ